MSPHLAQFNVSRALYSLDDPRMRGFMANIDRINGLADRVAGFVHRVKDDSGNALGIRLYQNDPLVLANLTVWTDEEALHRFVFQTAHKHFFARGHEWFDKSFGSKNVMWNVPVGYIPPMTEGVEKLAYYEKYGNTDLVFGWRIR